jgi:hypothetical protein
MRKVWLCSLCWKAGQRSFGDSGSIWGFTTAPAWDGGYWEGWAWLVVLSTFSRMAAAASVWLDDGKRLVSRRRDLMGPPGITSQLVSASGPPSRLLSKRARPVASTSQTNNEGEGAKTPEAQKHGLQVSRRDGDVDGGLTSSSTFSHYVKGLSRDIHQAMHCLVTINHQLKRPVAAAAADDHPQWKEGRFLRVRSPQFDSHLPFVPDVSSLFHQSSSLLQPPHVYPKGDFPTSRVHTCNCQDARHPQTNRTLILIMQELAAYIKPHRGSGELRSMLLTSMLVYTASSSHHRCRTLEFFGFHVDFKPDFRTENRHVQALSSDD